MSKVSISSVEIDGKLVDLRAPMVFRVVPVKGARGWAKVEDRKIGITCYEDPAEIGRELAYLIGLAIKEMSREGEGQPEYHLRTKKELCRWLPKKK